MLKNENGITLVALIITIIVLIILAAVSIIAINQIGLVDLGVNATQNYDNAQYYEQNVMDNVYNLVSKTVSNIEAKRPTTNPNPGP